MLSKKIDILDVGAIGNLDWPFSSNKKNINLIKIDPQFSKKDIAIENNMHRYVLWKNNENIHMNILKQTETSSLYEANLNFLSFFPESDRFETVKKEKFKAVTIKNMVSSNQIKNIDFIKLDTQGSELDILKGGENFLHQNLIGLQVEVEFEKMYKKQPLFYDVDNFVQNNIGLSIWDLDLRYFKYREGVNKQTNSKGRLIYANALYLRSIENLPNWLGKNKSNFAKEKLTALFKISLIYGYLDYCYALLASPIYKLNFDNLQIQQMNKMIKGKRILNIPFLRNRYIYFILKLISNHFKPTHNNWVYANSILGNKKWFKFFSQM